MIYKIKPTLSLKAKGLAVSNLKEALKEILKKFPNDMQMNGSDPLAKDFDTDKSTDEFTEITTKMVIQFQLKMMKLKTGTGIVDEATAETINKLLKLDQDVPIFTVSGTVTSYDNFPVVGKIVKAFDKDLRKEEQLGSATTDKNGYYTISYTLYEFTRAEKETADLFIRITDLQMPLFFNSNPIAKAKQYFQSKVYFNAQPELVIDVVLDKDVYRGDSEFARYKKSLAPVLDGVKIKDLTEEDVQFLANETGIIEQHISLLVKAHIFGNDESVMSEIYYGLLRQNLPTELKDLLSVKQQKLREALLKSIDQNIINDDLIKLVDAMLAKLIETAKKLLSEFSKDTTYTGIGAIIARAQINDALKQKFISLYLLHNDDELDKAIAADKELNDPKIKDEIEFVFALQNITAEDLNLLSVLSDNRNKFKLNKEIDIAGLEKDNWLELIKNAGLPPEIKGNNHEEKIISYADVLNKKVEKKYPVQVLQRTLIKKVDQGIKNIEEVLPTITDHSVFDSIRIPQNYKGDSAKLAGAIGLVNSYRYMGIKEVLSDANVDIKTKIKEVSDRVSSFHKFISNNPALNLSEINLLDKKVTNNLNWNGVSTEHKESVRKQAMAFQRLLALGISAGNVEKVAASGYHSGRSISTETNNLFIQNTGLSLEDSNRIRNNAANITIISNTMYQLIWASIRENSISPVHVSNWGSTNLENSLSGVSRFEDFFGNQDFCECTDCRSILSPAAYFVDLMRFIEKHLGVYLTGSAREIALKLRGRRPDLWGLPLTCENTNKLIPYLDIVIEVLEKYVISTSSSGISSLRRLYEALANEQTSFNLPFNRYTEESRIYLSHFETTLFDIFILLKNDEASKWRERLMISEQEFTVITTPDANSKTRIGNPSNLTEFHVKDFLRFAGIKREQLDELLNLNCTTLFDSVNINKKPGEEPLTDPLMNYIEVIDFNNTNLDFAHRFIRLWRKTPWTISQLDTILKSLVDKGLITNTANLLNDQAIIYCSKLVELQGKLNLRSEELPVLFSSLPYTDHNKIGVFEQIFGMEFSKKFPAGAQSPAITFHRNNTNSTEVDPNLGFLLAGMGISEAELTQLFQLLAVRFPFNVDGNVNLTYSDISYLYRHARLSKCLFASMEEMVSALKILDTGAGQHVDSIDKIFDIIAFTEKMKVSPYSFVDLKKMLFKDVEDTQDTQEAKETYLFNLLGFKEILINFFRANKNIFGIESAYTITSLFEIADFKNLIIANDDNKEKIFLLLQHLATGSVAVTEEDYQLLGIIWKCDKRFINNIANTFANEMNGMDAMAKLTYLYKCSSLCKKIGIGPDTLKKFKETSFNSQKEIAKLILGAFGSKYPDIKERELKLEPYHDKINTIVRDSLCDYVLSSKFSLANGTLKLQSRNDLYNYFLLDVEMSGCFRISKIVAANSSLQLYIHKSMMDATETNSAGDIINEIPHDEWQWRKNYRVWEANRKVFLYPENYILPELRHNRSPIFNVLQEELLQEKITKESAENAYKKYVSQFAVMAHLIIAGSYYDLATNTYYFFGRSGVDPFEYYYRKWVDEKTWTAWEKIDLPINAPCVTAIICSGKLYLFWMEINTKEKTTLNAGTQGQTKYIHHFYFAYSSLDENNKWQNSQKLEIPELESPPYLNNISSLISKRIFPGIDNNNHIVLFYSCYLPSPYTSVYHCMRLDLFTNSYQQDYTAELRFGDNMIPRNSNILLINTNDRLSLSKGTLRTNIYGQDQIEGLDKYYEDNMFGLVEKEIIANFQNQENFALDVVQKKTEDYIFRYAGRQYLLQKKQNSHKWNIIRLGTSLADISGEILFTKGLDTFLSTATQNLLVEDTTPFNGYAGDDLILPGNKNPFKTQNSNSVYFQELFFHIPFLIASHLNANQKFEEADHWYRKIFDPTGKSSNLDTVPTDRYWNYLEFKNLGVERMQAILSDSEAIEAYRKDPFNPHAIAQLRINAYPKTIIMSYIDNLIDWGDDLFAQDTIESINEATMLYILAQDILGERPVKLGKCEIVPEEKLTYYNLKAQGDEGSEFLVEVENIISNYVPESQDDTAATGTRDETGSANPHTELIELGMLAFCIPNNEKLIKYWDRVEDRLFKIRNCMNISGVRRQLALFQPPIDPMILVRARAEGLTLQDIVADLNHSPSFYRYAYLIEKARQFTQTVQNFGSALLSAMEKRDGEELQLLRTVHEKEIMNMMLQIKRKSILEAQNQQLSLNDQLTNIQNRIDYYHSLLDNGLTGWEITQQVSKHTATGILAGETTMHLLAGISYLLPQVGSPFAMKYGGKELADSLTSYAGFIANIARISEGVSASAGLEASFQRREQEWNQQLKTAQIELEQVKKQMLASGFRVEIAEYDLDIHKKNMENNDEVGVFYKNKFTSLGLYNYLAANLTRLYREGYALAYNMAQKAQNAFNTELGTDKTFIANDNWNAGRSGLVAGESLLFQLMQMEKDYIEANTREFELTKHISIAQLNPLALLMLKQTGTCNIDLEEQLFDLDYTGHYFRRIKSVSISIPCIVGPYTSVNCTLQLTSNRIRKNAANLDELDINSNGIPFNIIATSSAQNDSGIFELNFRDERYLPFEGAGVISTWKLELPDPQIAQFNYNSISDVIMHVKYTARDGGADLKTAALTRLTGGINSIVKDGLFRIISLKHDFPDQFHKLVNNVPQSAEFELTNNYFPYFLMNKPLSISGEVTVYLKPKKGMEISLPTPSVKLNNTNNTNDVNWNGDKDISLDNTSDRDKIKVGTVSVTGSPIAKWTIEAGDRIDNEKTEDILILIKYGIKTV